jgi:hypothetical protein
MRGTCPPCVAGERQRYAFWHALIYIGFMRQVINRRCACDLRQSAGQVIHAAKIAMWKWESNDAVGARHPKRLAVFHPAHSLVGEHGNPGVQPVA